MIWFSDVVDLEYCAISGIEDDDSVPKSKTLTPTDALRTIHDAKTRHIRRPHRSSFVFSIHTFPSSGEEAPTHTDNFAQEFDTQKSRPWRRIQDCSTNSLGKTWETTSICCLCPLQQLSFLATTMLTTGRHISAPSQHFGMLLLRYLALSLEFTI